MPTFDEVTRPYELLFRFDEVTGDLKGCHYKTITAVLKDGVAISSTPSDALPVSHAKGVSGLDLAPILGTLAASQAQVIEQHEATIKAHEADLKAKDAYTQELLEKCARLQSIVDTFYIESHTESSPAIQGGDPESTAPQEVAPPTLEETPPKNPAKPATAAKRPKGTNE